MRIDPEVTMELAVTSFLDEAEKYGMSETALRFIYNDKFDYDIKTDEEFVRALANNAVTLKEFFVLYRAAFGTVTFHHHNWLTVRIDTGYIKSKTNKGLYILRWRASALHFLTKFFIDLDGFFTFIFKIKH